MLSDSDYCESAAGLRLGVPPKAHPESRTCAKVVYLGSDPKQGCRTREGREGEKLIKFSLVNGLVLWVKGLNPTGPF